MSVTVRRNNLSLGELGIATGQYAYTTDTIQTISASYVSNRPQIKLSECNAGATAKSIYFSDFYGEVSGAYDGEFGNELEGGDQGWTLFTHGTTDGTADVQIGFQFENTGSLFRTRIASRWQNFTKRRNATVYWEINEETTNFQKKI